jgi:hypothetical protein
VFIQISCSIFGSVGGFVGCSHATKIDAINARNKIVFFIIVKFKGLVDYFLLSRGKDKGYFWYDQKYNIRKERGM